MPASPDHPHDPAGERSILSTHEKALQINLDHGKYGAFAEIGAGQEVARWFFRVGGAAGTIAKTISAYDMTVSDAIYGPCERYVSRQRLHTMLSYEYGLLHERLNAKRGSATRFFVFADTVAARSYLRGDDWHGWMGIRFQTRPLAAPSEIIIHVLMHDRENVQQQEALGIMGVNLIYAALYLHDRPDVLHKKPILVERGSFRPVTRATIDMLKCAQTEFLREPLLQGEKPMVLMEMTLKTRSTTRTSKAASWNRSGECSKMPCGFTAILVKTPPPAAS